MPRSKPKIAPRRPPPSGLVRDAQTPGRSGTQTFRRRTTVYFAPETFKRLNVYCAGEDRELSDVAEEAVSQWLNREGTRG